jgi:hypothetical protein
MTSLLTFALNLEAKSSLGIQRMIEPTEKISPVD